MDESDGELYGKLAPELTRFATGLVGRSEAADVVSDAVVRCMSARRWPSVKQKRAYLYRSVYHEALKLHRSRVRRQSREIRAVLGQDVEVTEIDPEVASAVRQLSVRQRAVTVLTYWNDLDPASISRTLRISEGAVRRHLARARARLRELLNADY